MSYLKIAAAAESPEFRQRVKAALFEIAQLIAQEPHTTPSHQYRVIMARAVTRAPEDYVSQLSWLCAATEPVWSSVTDGAEGEVVGVDDATIRSLCLQAWNTVAGAAR